MRIDYDNFAVIFIITISVSLITMSFIYSAYAQSVTNPDKISSRDLLLVTLITEHLQIQLGH